MVFVDDLDVLYVFALYYLKFNVIQIIIQIFIIINKVNTKFVLAFCPWIYVFGRKMQSYEALIAKWVLYVTTISVHIIVKFEFFHFFAAISVSI